MGSRIFESVWTLTLWLLVFFSLGFGEAKAEVYPVDITHDTLGWHITPCPLPGVSGDTWRFTNSASDTIYLFFFIPVCVKKQSPHFYILAPEDSVDHQIGGWEGRVGVVIHPYGLVAHCGRIYPPQSVCPTLTQWGSIALVLLLLTTTLFIMLRKRKTAFPT